MASLFQACKTVVRNQASDTFNIGGYDIGLELYHQSDINAGTTLGDNDESKIVVIAGDTITVPNGYTLTPNKPKKSLVIFCNNLINNGTISMYQKAPNVLPHDYFILESNIAGTAKDIVIPAYADNASNAVNGIAGTNRNCGSGGTGSLCDYSGNNQFSIANVTWGGVALNTIVQSGSGYAFGGGAGSGGCCISRITSSGTDELGRNEVRNCNVNTTYSMRGGTGIKGTDYTHGTAIGGAGNPDGGIVFGDGIKSGTPPFGCGGRIIIFCNNFTNNGIIKANGTDGMNVTTSNNALGGASGGGAVDVFYTTLNEQGIINVAGGIGYNYAGSGGNGSITLTQWTQNKIVKETIKYFSRSNVNYLLTQLAERIKDSRMGE